MRLAAIVATFQPLIRRVSPSSEHATPAGPEASLKKSQSKDTSSNCSQNIASHSAQPFSSRFVLFSAVVVVFIAFFLDPCRFPLHTTNTLTLHTGIIARSAPPTIVRLLVKRLTKNQSQPTTTTAKPTTIPAANRRSNVVPSPSQVSSSAPSFCQHSAINATTEITSSATPSSTNLLRAAMSRAR